VRVGAVLCIAVEPLDKEIRYKSRNSLDKRELAFSIK